MNLIIEYDRQHDSFALLREDGSLIHSLLTKVEHQDGVFIRFERCADLDLGQSGGVAVAECAGFRREGREVVLLANREAA